MITEVIVQVEKGERKRAPDEKEPNELSVINKVKIYGVDE